MSVPVRAPPVRLTIREVRAYPTSFPVDPRNSVTLGIGRTVKRDAVVVKVTTEDGLTGWGEAHHGRCPGAVAHLVNTTMRTLVVGQDADDVSGIWKRVYDKQLASHGMGAGACLALSGIDMAIWDLRAKARGVPLYRLLGGAARLVPAYAGGVSLGYQDPARLVEEARAHIDAGYKAVKLRVGDTVKRDLERVAAVRKAFGDELVIFTDANTGYRLADARAALPGLEAQGVGWLEEPFPAHDWRSYREAKPYARVPLAAGENHYTRFEFDRIIDDGAITVLQPDLSKTGGITEALRIAALAGTWKLALHPHTSMTALNMAASIHFLVSIDNSGYFEADVSKANLFRDKMVDRPPYAVDAAGCVMPLEAPGIGLDVDEAFLAAHPVIEGPAYV
ncbi:MAG TPA: mandelate racemase/muconate lactonizing enzyme family protein [Burkholderiales bacterium]|nr:mandelate racemase/muconate lactonizing enzyme family protein [Burkholderiales bacterium]